jgi:putative membrane protein insertion efficiency factor
MLRSVLAAFQKISSTFFLTLIWCYQKGVSPFLGSRCRFYPSCSDYAKESFKTHSLIIALWLVTKRLLKCQPLHSGGYDPVPEKK